MNPVELRHTLQILDLNQAEAARLLSVNPRTMRRWIEGSSIIPAATAQALGAWKRLARFGLPWRPDEIMLADLNEDEIAKQSSLHRNHVVGLDAIIASVEKRGGPATPWKVDLQKCQASTNFLEIGFYRMPNGGFSPSNYRRKDGPPNLERDKALIEDAYYCIAKTIAATRPRPK
jgi:hypothetical protein